MDKFREEVQRESNAAMKKKASLDPQASMGYGGKFGVESDRMDKSALGKKILEIRKIILVFLMNEQNWLLKGHTTLMIFKILNWQEN